MSQIFNKVISTVRPTVTTDGQGIDVENFSTVTTIDANVRASIQQMSQSASFAFSRRGMDVDFEIYTPTRLLAKLGDRITDPDNAGVFYEIRDVEDMAGRGRFFCCYCKRLKLGA